MGSKMGSVEWRDDDNMKSVSEFISTESNIILLKKFAVIKIVTLGRLLV